LRLVTWPLLMFPLSVSFSGSFIFLHLAGLTLFFPLGLGDLFHPIFPVPPRGKLFFLQTFFWGLGFSPGCPPHTFFKFQWAVIAPSPFFWARLFLVPHRFLVASVTFPGPVVLNFSDKRGSPPIFFSPTSFPILFCLLLKVKKGFFF